MSDRTSRQVEDRTGCGHYLVGPQRTVQNKQLGHCDKCGREVAIEVDDAGSVQGSRG
jgi:hypothetical protein